MCGCERMVITSDPSARPGPAFSVYNGMDQSELSVQQVSGPAVWSYINCRQPVCVCVCVFSQSIILNRTRPEVVLLHKHFTAKSQYVVVWTIKGYSKKVQNILTWKLLFIFTWTIHSFNSIHWYLPAYLNMVSYTFK